MTQSEQKLPDPRQKLTVIRHFPFQWKFSQNVDIDDILSRAFFSAVTEPGHQDYSTMSGFADYEIAAKAIAHVVEASYKQPENVLFLQSLAHQLVKSLANSWANKSTETLVALSELIIHFIEDESSDLLEPVARGRLSWPCLVTLKELKSPREGKGPIERFSSRERLEAIHLGADAITKDLSRCEPNQIAHQMIEAINLNQRLLAELKIKRESNPEEFARRYQMRNVPEWVLKCESPEPLRREDLVKEWSKWFEVGWEALLEATDGRPEEIPDLREVGIYRAKKNQENSKPKHQVKDSKRYTKTHKSNIRDGIKTKIKEAFKRLVGAQQQKKQKNNNHSQ